MQASFLGTKCYAASVPGSSATLIRKSRSDLDSPTTAHKSPKTPLLGSSGQVIGTEVQLGQYALSCLADRDPVNKHFKSTAIAGCQDQT